MKDRADDARLPHKMSLAELCRDQPDRAYAIYKAQNAAWGASRSYANIRIKEDLLDDPVSHLNSQ